MQVYHYTRQDNWKSMSQPGNTQGLQARTRYAKPYLPPAVFAYLEPQPREHIANPYFGNMFSDLFKHTGRLLLAVEIDAKDPAAFVLDRAHAHAWRRRERYGEEWYAVAGLPEEYRHLSYEASRTAYAASKVSLQDYLDRSENLGMLLPEVMIARNVSLDHIRRSEFQPYLPEGNMGQEGETRGRREY